MIAAQLESYDPKKDGGCAVALGYDMDMPGDPAYLYDRALGWQRAPNRGRTDSKGQKNGLDFCHGHLNEDIIEYVLLLAETAERYDARIQFFLQGNTFEDPIDHWRKIAGNGHGIDSHMYYHVGLIHQTPEEVRSQLEKTKELIEESFGTVNIGLRGPGGYPDGLLGREDIQQAILDAGIQWVSTQIGRATPGDDLAWINLIPARQPFYYPTGLLEIPFGGHQDRSFFDVDMGGSPRPIHEWIGYLKRCVDLAYDNNLFYAQTVHPSTSFKHDPRARYLHELLEYCRKRPDIVVCTFQDMYRWLTVT